jgi:polyferredoxin
MDKVGRPRSLIAYDTVRNLESVGPEILRINWLRPRVILYATLMAIVGVIMLTALLLRPELEVNVLHDRNPIYVRLSDGGLRNGYTVKILNKLYEPRSFKIGVTGLPGAKLSIIGHEKDADPLVMVAPDELQSVRLYVALDKNGVAALPEATQKFFFTVSDSGKGTKTEHGANFQGPEQ